MWVGDKLVAKLFDYRREMAAKLLHSLTDDNPDLQIGCMTGIFQMFDRQHMLTYSTKRLPPPGKDSYTTKS